MPQQEKYNLQRLLEMRERGRDEAATHLAECRRQLSAAENELTKRKQAVADCRRAQQDTQSEMIERSQTGMKSSEMIRYRQHFSDLREQETTLVTAVEEQEGAVKRAEQTVEKALDLLNEAAKEVKVIEKHRANWQQTKRIEGGRREQKTNDEIANVLHERKFD